MTSQQKRRRKKRSAFIEDEAALSGEDDSGDDEGEEDGAHLDAFEASFVDDATQRGNDDEAMYLKSIKSPTATRGRGGLQQQRRPLRPVTADLFSQV